MSEEIKNMKPINLIELIEAFDLQSDFLSFYVNLRSGEIVSVTEEEIAAVEYEDINIQKVLDRAIKGKGAFGRFHTAIQAYKIENQWYEYQHDRLKEMAIDWCNLNRLVFSR